MEFINKNKVLGFIGLGVMGESMARNLLKSGYTLHIYTRSKYKANYLIEEGAIWEQDVKSIALKCDVIMTMVGDPFDVEEIYIKKDGLLNFAKEDSILIDFTTSTPLLAKEIYERARKKNIHSLDAPVSGGDIGAREGILSIMVGGDKVIFNYVLPILEILGENIIWQGDAGSGHHTKMCNQIAIASNMIGVCEAMAYAKKSGLDQEKVLQSISKGAAGSWSLSNLAPRMIHNNFEPGFYIKHFIKDMKISLEEAKNLGLDLFGVQLAKELYEVLSEKGESNSGTQTLYKSYLNDKDLK